VNKLVIVLSLLVVIMIGLFVASTVNQTSAQEGKGGSQIFWWLFPPHDGDGDGASSSIIGGGGTARRDQQTNFPMYGSQEEDEPDKAQSVIPLDAEISQLSVRLQDGTTPGGEGSSYFFRVYRNEEETSVECRVFDDQLSCDSKDGAGECFAKDDLISVKQVHDGPEPENEPFVRWTAVLTPSDGCEEEEED